MAIDVYKRQTLELLESFREQLGDVRYRRARHVIGENARVNAFANALSRGDWDEAGVAMRGSHASLRDDYEAVSYTHLDVYKRQKVNRF